ncbi:MAG TPA: glycosyltransferase family 2 protein [Rhizobiaceae bacterium]
MNVAKRQLWFLGRRDFRDVEIHRKSPGALRPLSANDFALVVSTHNDMRLMGSFLQHYRALGVTRFLCVDDLSTDDTAEFLLAQPDVELFTSNVRYKDADRGKIWRERLFAIFGRDRWYLSVDSDEFFLYETAGSERIGDFVRRLDRAGVRRLPAPMLDLYPVGDLSRAVFSGADGSMPWEIATHFDGGGYRANAFNTGISIYGGVRARVFQAHGELMKYPLLRWDRYCSLGRTIHRPRPSSYNFGPALGILLHFKIFSDLRQTTETAVQEGQHYKDAKVYKAILGRLGEAGSLDLSYEDSIPFAGVDDLMRRGFMLPLTASGRG